MLTEAGAAVGSIKTALDMLKGVRSLKSETDINQAVIEVQRILLEAQSAAVDDKARQIELLNRISDLEARLAEGEEWESEKRRYRLTEFSTGRFAFVLADDFAEGEPAHKLCAKCFTERRKSILQTLRKHSGGESVLCQHCKQEMVLAEFPPDPVLTVRRDRYIDLQDY
jgi:hypothetical protein